MRTVLPFAVLTFLLWTAPAVVHADPVDHAPFSAILATYVRGGRVDYAGLLKDRTPLDRYLDQMRRVSEADYNHWPEKEKIAFWINLYNAEMLHLMLSHPGTKSVRSVGWFLGAFREKDILMPSFRERTVSLDYIEKDILRDKFGEPRAHFALVGAAKGGAILRSEAYDGKHLDVQLEEQARDFMRDPNKVRFDKGVLYVSVIFDWYKKDFQSLGGTVTMLERYSDPATRNKLLAGAVKMKSLDYDWSLNGVW